MAATNCIDTLLFGQVCDSCDAGAIMKMVAFGLKIFTAGVLIAATIGIIICGVKWMTARDDAAQLANAKKRMLEIIIGIGVYALMFVVADFIIPGGIVKSTTDTTTSSCPEASTIADANKGKTGDDDGGDGGGNTNPETPEGKYPMAHLAGEAIPGYIQCPRNAGRTYSENPNGKTESWDKFFKSEAQSCPFTNVEYTKTAEDLACAPGYTMHYATVVNEKRKNGSIVKETKGPYCLVNTKVDIGQYQNYLVENYISQDNRLCTTNGECVDGGESVDQAIREYNHCNHFSFTFTANLNHGEVVSNDILTSKCGVGFLPAYWKLTKYGNTQTTWGGRTVSVYDDALSGINIDQSKDQRLPYAEYETKYGIYNIINALRSGIVVTTQSTGQGWSHYVTAVGFTKDCMIGSTATCNYDDIIFLDSTWGTIIQEQYATLNNQTWPDKNIEVVCYESGCKSK